jgi:hypothetical protein
MNDATKRATPIRELPLNLNSQVINKTTKGKDMKRLSIIALMVGAALAKTYIAAAEIAGYGCIPGSSETQAGGRIPGPFDPSNPDDPIPRPRPMPWPQPQPLPPILIPPMANPTLDAIELRPNFPKQRDTRSPWDELDHPEIQIKA